MNPPSLWTVVEHLPPLVPFSKQKVESALRTPLVLASENEFVRFYEAPSVALADGVVLEKVDLRIHKTQPDPGFVAFKLTGACVSRSEVLARFDRLELSDHPRGRSLDEETSFSRQEPWGLLTFGFSERSPDCLRTVVFDPSERGT